MLYKVYSGFGHVLLKLDVNKRKKWLGDKNPPNTASSPKGFAVFENFEKTLALETPSINAKSSYMSFSDPTFFFSLLDNTFIMRPYVFV